MVLEAQDFDVDRVGIFDRVVHVLWELVTVLLALPALLASVSERRFESVVVVRWRSS